MIPNCPACGKSLGEQWKSVATRPFCSPRCKMTDLGQWFAERYSVPAETSEDAEDAPTPAPRKQ